MSKETYTHIKREKENKSLLELLEIVMYGNEHKRAIGEVDQAYEDLKQVLKPPSEQELCEALSEFLQGTNINASVEVTFENNNFMYFHTIVVQDIGGHLRFDFPVALPPRLISLICRFYEGRGEAR